MLIRPNYAKPTRVEREETDKLHPKHLMASTNPDSPSANDASEPHAVGHDPYAALRIPEFRRFLAGNLLFLFGSQMQALAVGWELYAWTGNALHLGLVGLVQVIPVVLLALPAGQLIDRVDRRRVIMTSLVFIAAASLGLAAISFWRLSILGVYGCLIMNGIARAFQQPAKSALLPQIVPRERFASAVTWSTSGFQLATVVGPGLGGMLMAWTGAAYWIYLLDAALAIGFCGALLFIAPRPPSHDGEPISLRSLSAGATFLWRTKLLLGALSLDMFAVLLGGAVTLLPVFAKDILATGPTGLGWLRAAPGIGALIMSFLLTHLPPIRRAGPTLLWSVAGFGVATIVFGFARDFWLAWTMLLLTGALDMISVIIRHTLVQLWTPDSMRGRVSAVNGMFISISNELGGFESGLVAHLFHRSNNLAFGPTVSVVSGGIGTLLVVCWAALVFPQLRRHGRLDATPDEHGESSVGRSEVAES